MGALAGKPLYVAADSVSETGETGEKFTVVTAPLVLLGIPFERQVPLPVVYKSMRLAKPDQAS